MSNAMVVFVVWPGHLWSAAVVAGVDASYGDAGPTRKETVQ